MTDATLSHFAVGTVLVSTRGGRRVQVDNNTYQVACLRNIVTGRRSRVAYTAPRKLRGYRPVTSCEFKGCPNGAMPQSPYCCSSHGRVLCHPHYKFTHFVEDPCACEQCVALAAATTEEEGR